MAGFRIGVSWTHCRIKSNLADISEVGEFEFIFISESNFVMQIGHVIFTQSELKRAETDGIL